MIKKTTIAILLNLFFGGVGYFYLKEVTRIPLGIILTAIAVAKFLDFFNGHPDLGMNGNPFLMLSFFNGLFGTVLVIAMVVDVYFIVKRQTTSGN